MLADDASAVAIGKGLLGKAIRERRVAASLTQAQLAESAGITRSHLTNVELGNALPSLDLLFALARSLDTTARLLLKDVFPWDAAEPPASDS